MLYSFLLESLPDMRNEENHKKFQALILQFEETPFQNLQYVCCSFHRVTNFPVSNLYGCLIKSDNKDYYFFDNKGNKHDDADDDEIKAYQIE